MKLTKKLQAEVLKAYHLYWDSYLKGDMETFASLLDEACHIIGATQFDVFDNKKDAVAFYSSTANEVARAGEFRNRKINVLPYNENVMVQELYDYYFLHEGQWHFHGHGRISALFSKKEKGWKIIHQHGSLPGARAEEGTQSGTEKIKEENLQLREAVKCRTVEIEHKNRELEIEASLERVRARAMAMQKSEELSDLVAVVFNEMIRLNVVLSRCMIWICDPVTLNSTAWMASPEKSIPDSYSLQYNEHEVWQAQLAAWKKRTTNWMYNLEGEGKKNWDGFLFNETGFSRLPDVVKKAMQQTEKAVISASFNNFGGLVAVAFEPFTEGEMDLLQRFGKVFDLTYTRFNDLQKAEAQAKEAEIELGLERVRARAMAMHKSDELLDAGKLLYKELTRLGIVSNTCGYVLMDAEEKIGWIYAASPADGSIAPKPTGLPHESEVMKSIKESWKKHEAFHVVELDPQATIEHHTYIAKNSIDFLFTLEEFLSITPERVVLHSFNFKQGYLLVVSGVRLTLVQEEMAIRFTKVFEMTYRRFLDLQKAEAQAREAKIEAALERVRAKSMAMHKSEELGELSFELVKQVQSLGVATWHCAFNIYDEEQKGSTEWGSNASGTYPIYKTPRVGIFLRYYQTGQTGESLHVEVIGEDRCADHYAYLCTLPGVGEQLVKLRDSGVSFPTSQIDHVAYFKYGYLLFITYEPVPEAHDIFKRFAKVFEQTYTRFLDLQKAEAQTKEAQIEAALEKVRSSSLAMHRSDELSEVILVVFEKLKELNVVTDGVALINLYAGGTKDVIQWIANPELMTTGQFTLPYFNHPILNIIWEARESGKDFVTHTFDFEEKNSFWNYAFQHTDYKYLSDDLKKMLLESEGYGYIVAFEKYSSILVCTYTKQPFSASAIEIVKRFARVFEQAYIRFLDLQKAEAQAREAMIEAAFERVRSKTMAMHSSNDLLQVVSVLKEQLLQLRFNVDAVSFITEFTENSYNMWLSSPGERVLSKVYVPRVDFSGTKLLNEALQNGRDFVSYVLSKEEKDVYFKNFLENTILKNAPPETKQEIYHAPGMATSLVLLKSIILTVGNFKALAYTDHENNIIKRFGYIFEQSYIRFLDLQKAEAQAREAQIELGLERVRARAMAMQKSDELRELIGTVFIELTKLDLVLTRCLIMIYDPDSNASTWWMANSEAPTDPIGLYIKYHEHPPYLAYINAWRDRKYKWQYILEGRDKKEWDDFLFVETELSQLPGFVIEGMKTPDKVYLNASFNSFGNLTLATLEPLSNEHFDILLRFAKVFDLTYTRFNDLQKAEAQAREAQIQLALERVRARTMAMQHSEELAATAAVLFEQLEVLGEAPERVAIEIVNEKEHVFEVWATQHGGSQLNLLFKASLDEPHVMQKMYRAWKQQKKSITIDLQGNELEEYFQFLKNAGAPVQRDIFGIRRVQNVATFSKGILTIITPEPRPRETIDILERFAAVFDGTYTRFLDLQKAEAQAREAQIEAALERVRSKTMAMHQSPELQYVIEEATNQLVQLGFNVGSANFSINLDIHTNPDMHLWVGVPGTQGYFTKIIIPYFDHPIFTRTYQAIDNGDEILSDVFSFEEKNRFYEYVFEHTVLKNTPQERKDFVLSVEGMVRSTVLSKNSALTVIKYDDNPYTPEENAFLKRMGQVFEQAYTRFLDLQKAEAQAKEAQIEAALERVRSRTMGMQKSEELKEIIRVVHEQFLQLNILIEHAGFIMDYKARDDMHIWLADRHDIPTEVTIPYFDSPHWNSFIEAKQKDLDFFANHLSFEEKNKFYDGLFKLFPGVPNEAKEYYFNAPGLAISTVLLENVGLYIENFKGVPYTYEENNTLMRFGKVFQQTYTRFLDLQKAEAQAREAKIEASLERVRSKAMAMHDSQDLADTIGVFYRELHSFSITPIRCGVGLLDREERVGELFTWNTTQQGKSLELVGRLKMEGHPVLNKVYESWITQTEYHPVLRGAEIKEYYSVLRPQIAFPDYTHDDVQYGHFFFFKEGGVYAWTEKEMKEDELQIYRRFTSVLSLTYKRYRDLQQAETNAREAQIEAALERVRSRTLAMQKSDELPEASAVLFKQLINLGIEPNRLYITIIKNENGESEFWITDEDGSKVSAAFQSNMNDNRSFKKMFDGWKANQKSMVIDMKGKELQEYFQHLSSLHVPFKNVLIQKRRLQYIAYFNKGFIGMASPDEQPEETALLLERFAAVFNLTFTRFNDLKIAEAHAVQAEEDLIEIKAARKKAEDTLTELQVTQKQLVHAEKMASLGELTAGIAHEIQNPLNFVNNFSEVSNELVDEMKEELATGNMQLANEIADDIKQNLEKINHHGKRADAIVKGMLQHSRTGSGQKELTDINALADEYLRLAYHGLRAKDKTFNADFKTAFDESIPKINIVPQDIGRVLLNIINNAFYAVNEKAKTADTNYHPLVIVTTKRCSSLSPGELVPPMREGRGEVVLTITDNGNGIPPHIIDKIFQPFFTTKPTGQGTGLGLSLAYDIVKAHGGELKVETKEGVSSEFIIILPA